MASEYGLSPLNLVLIVMLYFMGAHSGIFPRFWEKKVGGQQTFTLAQLYNEMMTLRQYFNHETTERLDGIMKAQNETHEVHLKVKERVEDLHRKNLEWEKYGIPIRNLSK